MNYKRGVGIGLIIISLILIISNTIITGAVIGHPTKNYLSLLGILIFVVGVFFILTTTRGWNNYRVGLVVREYESGTLSPVQAALKINDRLFPEGLKIIGVDYRGGAKETIKTKEGFIPVQLNDERKARDLALALYELAVINDRANSRNCELHLSRQASSKHHREGLRKIIENFEHKYYKDLELARA